MTVYIILDFPRFVKSFSNIFSKAKPPASFTPKPPICWNICWSRWPNRAKKQPGKVLFIDARNMGSMVTRKLRELTEEDILKIAGTYDAYVDGTLEDEKGYCAVVGMDEIEKQDYILTPGRYVGITETEDDGEPFQEKMERLTGELSELFAKSHELEAEIKKQLASIGFTIK